MTTPKRRFRLIVYRWISMVWCGIVAATVVFALDPLLRQLCSAGVDRLSKLHPITLTVMSVILVAAACWSAGRRRWPGFFGLRFFFAYPPLWVAVLVALVVQVLGTTWLALTLVVATLAVVSFPSDICSLVRDRRDTVGVVDGKGLPPTDEFDTLCRWLRDDSEISSPASDRFHHDVIARRMAARLTQKEEAPTMAVIGPLGSGKSSIRGLTEYYLRDTPRVRLIHISLWPFDSTEAAVRGILRAIVNELGRHVNVLPLAGISDDYIGAIEKTAGGLGGIARLLRRNQNPEHIVREFSDIACAIGLRLVLWIEDLERFSGGDHLRNEARAEREVERLGPIRALLYLLDRCDEVSVVVSDTSLRTRFDIDKIARFVEQLPALDIQDVWRETNLIRTGCLGGYPLSIIDAASPKARKALELEEDKFHIRDWLSRFEGAGPGVPDAIVHVLKTPRALKSALRITLESWEAMPGEIDFDCVLVASAVRVAHPDLFALVSEHVDLFLHALTDPASLKDGERKPHGVVGRIEELLNREDERTATSLRALVHFLFPEYPPDQAREDGKEYISRPQAFCAEEDGHYWRRYLGQPETVDADTDQKALASIAAWRDGKPADLIHRIIDSGRSEQIRRFVGQFMPSDLCRLLNEVADHVATQSAADWYHRAHAPGVATVWQMMHDRRPEEENVYRTVLDIVRRTASTHLPLAYDVAYFFAGNNPRVSRLMSDAQQQDVAEHLREAFVAHFIGDGADQRLAHALRDGSPWLIRWSAYFNRDDHTTLPFDRWHEFSDVLLTLAENQPAIGVPFAVALLAETEMNSQYRRGADGELEAEQHWVAQFNADAARRLFDYNRLKRVLASFEVPEHLDEQMKASCREAINWAQTSE